MAPRLQLHEILLGITDHVYFQPPTNVQLQYPCIIYSRDAARSEFADDMPYRFDWRYAVTIIDQNPDSTIPDQVAELPMCIFNRFFPADNLNHYVFNLFF